MPNCMICGGGIVRGSEINEIRDTMEHLFPESIGGRKGVSGFIHRGCNSKAGATWDAMLATQLQPLCLMFNIARQDGETAPLRVVTTADEHLTISPGGRLRWTTPIFEKTTTSDGKTAYKVNARDMGEARRILQGLQRKHPGINVDAALAQAKLQESYAQGVVRHDLGFGGEVSGRSIIKSCLAMAFASGVDWSLCEHAVRYMRDATAEPCFGYYQERDLVTGRMPGMPLHCLAVRADPATGLILAYAEYFGIHRVVACLGASYAGSLIEGCYALDPRDGSTQQVSVALSFSQSDVNDIYAYRRITSDAMKAAMAAIIGPEMKLQHEAEQRRVVSREVDKAFDTCGAQPGERLTQEHLAKIAHSVVGGVMPFLAHRMQPMAPMLSRSARGAQRGERKVPKRGE